MGRLNLCFSLRIILIIGLFLPAGLSAQQKVKLVSSNYVEGGRKDGERYNKVIGNVFFIQGLTEIYCDSAFFYKKENALEAFGHIRIFDREDSVTITADKLNYTGDSRFAELRDHVIYRGDSIILFTDHLDYDVTDKSARYFNGGRILNGRNELTSLSGFYDSPSRNMTFLRKVVLENPDNTLKADTLYYNMVTEIARTIGPTTIISSDGSVIQSKTGGEFYMASRQTEISAGAIETETYLIKGDKLFYDRIRGINHAEGNVYMYSKTEDIVITGQFADSYQAEGITKIYGNPVMRKRLLLDTLYLSADTLMSIDSEKSGEKRLLAFKDVRIYRFDLQGIADSLSYIMSDSVLYLYNDPVLWNTGNQIEADTISILIAHNQIDRMNLLDNGFIILTDTAGNYNQLKGKIMVAYFQNNRIKILDVNGNSECLFHALNETDNTLMGVNRIVCSSMSIRFVNNRASDLTFYKNPEARFIPPHEMEEPDRRLSGFELRDSERPDLFHIFNRDKTTDPPAVPSNLPEESQ